MAIMSEITMVWVFNGFQSNFPSGIFVNKNQAEDWITANNLTGTLTLYPVGVGVYEWAIANKLFTPKKETQTSALFIGKFSSAARNITITKTEGAVKYFKSSVAIGFPRCARDLEKQATSSTFYTPQSAPRRSWRSRT